MKKLNLKSLMGNSMRSIHVVVAISLSISLIYSSLSVTDGLITRAHARAQFDWTLVIFCFTTSLSVGLLGGVISIRLRKPGQETYGSLKQI